MFETKSGLRTIATLIISAALTIAATTPAQAAVQYPKTVSYLSSQFVDGKYVVGFTAGKQDFGMTLEAMLQLLAAGKDEKSQSTAVTYNLKSAKTVGLWSTKSGALYSPDKRFIVSDAGKYLFTYAAFKQSSGSLFKDVLATVKKHIAKDGSVLTVPDNSVAPSQNIYTSAWLVLGLKAINETALAEKIAVNLTSFSVAKTGGFADTQTDSTAGASPDATGLALQALGAVKGIGSKSEEAKKNSIIASSRKWLASISEKDSAGSFFSSWGEWSANSTAYAAMGLKATGSNIAAFSKWLASKVSTTDNGIQAGSWTAGAGNGYATLQGYAALIGKSYLDLIK
jgi:prophage antirepressor-like protein